VTSTGDAGHAPTPSGSPLYIHDASVLARLLNVADRHGVLAPGAVFDTVLLTPELEVVATFVAGRFVHAEYALESRFADLDADQR
jgi:hypothetical protein